MNNYRKRNIQLFAANEITNGIKSFLVKSPIETTNHLSLIPRNNSISSYSTRKSAYRESAFDIDSPFSFLEHPPLFHRGALIFKQSVCEIIQRTIRQFGGCDENYVISKVYRVENPTIMRLRFEIIQKQAWSLFSSLRTKNSSMDR